MSTKNPTPDTKQTAAQSQKTAASAKDISTLEAPKEEKGGFRDAGLLEPTRHGDWDVKGRCSDF